MVTPDESGADAPVFRRGDIVSAYLDPVVGREQAGRRPVLVISSDDYNRIGTDLVLIMPISSRDRGFPTHVALEAEESGLPRRSFVMTEQIRCISVLRIRRVVGHVGDEVLRRLADPISYLLLV